MTKGRSEPAIASPECRSPRSLRLRVRVSVCVLVLILVGAASLGGYAIWGRRAIPLEPPAVALDEADPAVAAAINRASARVRQAPRSAAAWGELGLIFLAHDFRAEALACFREAERLDDREPRWPYFCGLTLTQSDPDAAIPELRRAVELWGDAAESPRLRLAETLLGQGRFDEAGEQFRRLLEIQPDNEAVTARAELGLARIALEQDDWQGSLAHLDRCASNPCSRKVAHALRAEIRQRQGDMQAAVREMRQANAAPANAPDPDPFLEEMERRRTGKQALFARVSRLLDQDRVEEARAALQQGSRDYPDSAEVWLALGRAQVRRQDYPAAEQALRVAVRLAPQLVDAQFYMGVALFQQGNPGGAAAYFRRATELKPDYALASYNLGQCLKREGDEAGAMAAFRAAVRAKPHYAQAHASLGELLARAGRKAEALEHLRHAVDLAPADSTIRQLLTKVERPNAAPNSP
jgi:tetratricopeptide (TPR) repeat protein